MKKLTVTKGKGGYGGPLTVYETDTKKVIASITGGGIHPLAAKIAELLDVPAVDGFNNKVEPETIIIAVVDCGGTLRCGVYPKMGVPTIDIHPISPSGPLASYMNENNFVSGVKEDNLSLMEDDKEIEFEKSEESETTAVNETVETEDADEGNKFLNIIASVGKVIGKFVNVFYQAGRDSIDIIIKNILPFMAFVSVLVGIILFSGLGDIIANAIKPLAGTLPGLLILSVICALPFLSPILGPGAVIAQVVGVLLGVEIGKGTIPISYSLPALFAINSQVGCDFVPVALTMAEAEDETVKAGVPAMLFSRLVTGPIAVVIAYLFSIGMY